MDLLTEALNLTRDQEANTGTPNFLRGLMAGIWTIRPNKINETLDAIENDGTLVRHLVALTTAIPIGQLELERISRAVEARSIEEEKCRELSWGAVLNDAPEEGVRALINTLCDRGPKGYWVAIELLGMHLHGQQAKKRSFVDITKRIVLEPGLLSARAESVTPSQLDVHIFEEMAIFLVKENGDADVAVHLASELISLIRGGRFPYELEHTISNIVRALLEHHAENVWPIFGETIVAADEISSLDAETLIVGLSPNEKNNLELVPVDVLIEWAENGGTSAQSFLLKTARAIERMDDGSYRWSDLINAVLDRFGDDQEVLHGLSGNIWTFSHSGPIYAYYEQFLTPLEQLKDHLHDAVRDWALKLKETLTKEIEKEKKIETEEAMTGFLN